MVRDRSSRFSDNQRDILGEDRIRLTSVGVDIGSSTSHLVFSRLELELQQDRYVMVERTVLKQSDILLTPYRDATTIDGDALETFIEQQYAAAGLSREDVDTGALILTGRGAAARQRARDRRAVRRRGGPLRGRHGRRQPGGHPGRARLGRDRPVCRTAGWWSTSTSAVARQKSWCATLAEPWTWRCSTSARG